MSDLIETATDGAKKKLGPLPVWVWGLVLGGGGLVAYMLYSRSAGSSVASNPDSASGIGSATIDANGYTTAGVPSAVVTSDASQPGITDNTAWIAAASSAVASSLAASASTVYAVLTKYTQGQSISSADKKYVDAAIGAYGAPPEGTAGISTIVSTVSDSINAIYQKYLGRDASVSELSTRSTAIASGSSTLKTVDKSVADSYSTQADGLILKYWGRHGSAAEQASYGNMLHASAGGTLASRRSKVAAALKASPEGVAYASQKG